MLLNSMLTRPLASLTLMFEAIMTFHNWFAQEVGGHQLQLC